MTKTNERRFGDGSEIEIRGAPSFSLIIEIRGGQEAILKPGPIRIIGIKEIKKPRVVQNFERACAKALDSFVNDGLPEPSYPSDEVLKLSKATEAWLGSGKGRGELKTVVYLTKHRLSLLAESTNVNLEKWQECLIRLESEIQQAVNNYKEKQYKKKALHNHP